MSLGCCAFPPLKPAYYRQDTHLILLTPLQLLVAQAAQSRDCPLHLTLRLCPDEPRCEVRLNPVLKPRALPSLIFDWSSCRLLHLKVAACCSLLQPAHHRFSNDTTKNFFLKKIYMLTYTVYHIYIYIHASYLKHTYTSEVLPSTIRSTYVQIYILHALCHWQYQGPEFNATA